MRVLGRPSIDDGDKQLILQMRQAGFTVPEVIRKLGGKYTKGQVDGFITFHNLTPEQLAARRTRVRNWKREHGGVQDRRPGRPEGARPELRSEPPPPYVLAERDRALRAPRSLTAALLGDPPLGRSAREKRQ